MGKGRMTLLDVRAIVKGEQILTIGCFRFVFADLKFCAVRAKQSSERRYLATGRRTFTT